MIIVFASEDWVLLLPFLEVLLELDAAGQIPLLLHEAALVLRWLHGTHDELRRK